ncbi:MAG: TIGR00366 family protein [Acidobacteriota bacterium]|nr:TIGR00366 family protein [Acidobacteriota bacterium]
MRRIGKSLSTFSRKSIPDAFVFALLLTILVYGFGILFTDHGPFQLIQDWYGGFWNLLTFSMQMVLILVTGYALASAPVVERLMTWLACIPRNGPQGVALVGLVAGLLGCLNWGLSLIAGALLARKVAISAQARGIKLHYPLAAAAGYLGQLIWHGGLSGSAPLLMNTQGHFLEASIGIVPLSETIFRPFNLIVSLGILTITPLVLMSMHPGEEDVEEMDQYESVRAKALDSDRTEPKNRFGNNRILVGIVCIASLFFLANFFWQHGLASLDLNIINFTLLTLGLLLHGTPARYTKAVEGGARAASGVILQFPFYAGIMGIMTSSGLASVIAHWFVTISTPLSYPFWTLLSAGLINLMVPSGGGQWAIQGPIVVEATQVLGVDVGRSIMAVSFGDELTNMIQPFWVLPLLGITRLRAGDVLGYTAVTMMVAFLIMTLGITFLP